MENNKQIIIPLLLAIAVVFTAFPSHGQNNRDGQDRQDDRGAVDEMPGRGLRLDYGLNLGGYFADKSTANYYNGSGDFSKTRTQSTLERILNPSFTYNYARIRESIGYDFTLHGWPTDMRYSPAMMIGLYATISLGRAMAFIAESNYSKLKAEDQFTLKLARFSSIEGDNIQRYLISGSEERVDIRLGLQYMFMGSSYVNPFLEAGVVATDTKVKAYFARIEQQTYSLHMVGTSQYYPERDYGIGLGAFGSLGLSMDVSEDFRFSFGYSGHYNRINLGNNEDFGLQHSIFIRLSLSNLFATQGN